MRTTKVTTLLGRLGRYGDEQAIRADHLIADDDPRPAARSRFSARAPGAQSPNPSGTHTAPHYHDPCTTCFMVIPRWCGLHLPAPLHLRSSAPLRHPPPGRHHHRPPHLHRLDQEIHNPAASIKQHENAPRQRCPQDGLSRAGPRSPQLISRDLKRRDQRTGSPEIEQTASMGTTTPPGPSCPSPTGPCLRTPPISLRRIVPRPRWSGHRSGVKGVMSEPHAEPIGPSIGVAAIADETGDPSGLASRCVPRARQCDHAAGSRTAESRR